MRVDLDRVRSTTLDQATALSSLARAVRLTRDLTKLRDQMSAAAAERRAFMLVANRGGVTLDELAARTGLNRSFVAKEIRQARDDWTGDPRIAYGLRGD